MIQLFELLARYEQHMLPSNNATNILFHQFNVTFTKSSYTLSDGSNIPIHTTYQHCKRMVPIRGPIPRWQILIGAHIFDKSR